MTRALRPQEAEARSQRGAQGRICTGGLLRGSRTGAGVSGAIESELGPEESGKAEGDGTFWMPYGIGR